MLPPTDFETNFYILLQYDSMVDKVHYENLYIYIDIYIHYTYIETSLKENVATDEDKDRNETCKKEEMKLE